MRQSLFTSFLLVALFSISSVGCSSSEDDAREAAILNGDTIVEQISVEPRDPSQVLLELRALLENPGSPRLSIDPAGGGLIAEGRPDEIDELLALLETLES